MIARSALTCSTCEHHHVTRIGLGHEVRHVHRFPCRKCGEDIEVALEADFERGVTATIAVSNCEISDNIWGDEIVNLDPNFVIPAEYQGRDQVFPRMEQMRALSKRAEALNATFTHAGLDELMSGQRPYRREDWQAEWAQLKRAWTLHRRGETVFSRNIVKKASAALYAELPLNGLADWLYRFAVQVLGPAGTASIGAAANRLNQAVPTPEFARLRTHYNTVLAGKRGRRYLAVLSEYFEHYTEFSQVQFLVAGGLPPAPDAPVASTAFERTRMFYGNAFEALADQLDLIALMNNILQGRAFDVFAELTLKKYYELDKSGRANCFAAEPDLACFAEEFDNQIRNASHHGGMEFDPVTQVITYRAGKGGTGPEQMMTYTDYLVRCVAIFSQVLRLMIVELVLTQDAGFSDPL